MLHRVMFASPLFCLIIATATSALSQPQRTSSEPGIWSKNMELLKPLNWSGKEPVLMQKIGDTNYLVTSVQTRFVPHRDTASPERWVSHLLVTNVQNPRNPSIAATIRGRDSSFVLDGNTHYAGTINFGYVAVWTDTIETSNLQSHTLAVVYVDSVSIVHVALHPDQDIDARFLIFDLTQALLDADSEGTTDIVLPNPGVRNVKINGHDHSDVYIGYIPLDDVNMVQPAAPDGTGHAGAHSLSVEPKRGILVMSPLVDAHTATLTGAASYVDLFDLQSIGGSSYLSTGFIIPVRITQSGGVPITIPDTWPGRGGSADGRYESLCANEVFPKFLDENDVCLYVAGIGNSGYNDFGNFREGGCKTMIVNFSAPSSALTYHMQLWEFAADRDHADSKVSPDSSFNASPDWHAWKSSHVNSFVPISIGDSLYFLYSAS